MFKLSAPLKPQNKMNLNVWNIKNLEPPPRNTYKVKNHDLDIQTLHEVLTEAFSTFKDQTLLNEEAAMLSRCIYRMKLKFRSDKGLKEMEKMNRALLQYLRMNIPQILETFCSMVPQKYTKITYLPTLNMLHYLLVRMQGLGKLMVRLIDSTKAAAKYMELRISIGHFWKVAFICLGVISRIFVLAKEILKSCCKFYSQLYPFCYKLKNIGSDWLPANYSLPKDLKSWLNIDWLDQDEIVAESAPRKIIPTIFDIVESDSEVEFCGEYTEINEDLEITDEYVQIKDETHIKNVGDINSNVEVTLKSNINKLYTPPMEEEDVGEIINPKNDKDKKINSKKKLKKQKLQAKVKTNLNKITARQLIDRINTLKDLKRFEKDFENIQKENLKIFKQIDRLQINMLHSSLKRLILKANKSHSNHVKINLCISKAKEVIKSTLM